MNMIPSRLRTWLESRTTSQTSAFPDISIVIPAYNEAERIIEPLITIIEYCDSRASEYEVIVVDDGSTDDTAFIVKEFSNSCPQVKLEVLESNRGKGGALRHGVLRSQGKLILITDADGSTPIEEMERLEQVIHAGYDVAIGSRAILDAETSVDGKTYRKVIGKTFNLLVNALLLPEVADTQCGFKLFSRNAGHFLFQKQRCNGFGFDTEILFLAFKVGMKVKEVSVNWHHVPGSKVNLAFDSLRMLIDLVIHKMNHKSASREEYLTYLASLKPPETTQPDVSPLIN